MVSSVPSIRCTTRKLGSTVGAVFWRGSQVLQEDILVDLRSLPLPILKPPTYILYCSLLSNFFQVFGCIAFAVNTSFFCPFTMGHVFEPPCSHAICILALVLQQSPSFPWLSSPNASSYPLTKKEESLF